MPNLNLHLNPYFFMHCPASNSLASCGHFASMILSAYQQSFVVVVVVVVVC